MRRSGLTAIFFALSVFLPVLGLNLGGCNPLGIIGGDSGSAGQGTPFNLPPTVIIRAIPDPTVGVAPLPVQFDSAPSTDDGIIVSRAWDFGDGGTSQDIAPVHIYQQNGVYTVRLTLTDDEGARASNTWPVTVTERPVAVIQVDRDSAENAPAQFSFDGSASFDPDAQPGDTLGYRWDFGDGAQEVIPIVTHTYSAAGTYNVTLTVTDATGVTGVANKIIQVGISQPEIEFRVPPTDTTRLVCSPNSPLWVQVVYDVEPGVPYTIRAGLDPDTDPTNGNDLQLDDDASDGVMKNDLNLALPTALDPANAVPDSTYYLWVELDTDRTSPTRVYLEDSSFDPVRPIPVSIVGEYPTTTAGAPDILLDPLNDDDAYVVLRATPNRQVFDVGPLDLGDRLYLSLLQLPGYADAYDATDFSMLVLDANERLFAWYDSGLTLFSRNSKIVVGHNSLHYYVVMDANAPQLVSSVHVRVQRAAFTDSQPRQQQVYLNFDGTGTNPISVAGSSLFLLPAFDVPGFDTATLTAVIRARVQALFAAYDFVILSSAAGDTEPTGPHLAIYFDTDGIYVDLVPDFNGDGVRDGDDLSFYGMPNFHDPRNDTLTGIGLVEVYQLVDDFPGLATEVQLGTAIGNSAVHQIGRLSGLRETETPPPALSTDVMTNDSTRVEINTLDFEVQPLAPLSGQEQIGIQDATLLLQELFGT